MTQPAKPPTLGVCYYPEHWPENTWAEDAARMRAIGLTWVRVGEFAWSELEPEPGSEPKSEPEPEPKPKPRAGSVSLISHKGPKGSKPLIFASNSEGRMRRGAEYVPGSRHTWHALPAELTDRTRIVLRTRGEEASCMVRVEARGDRPRSVTLRNVARPKPIQSTPWWRKNLSSSRARIA